jgi:hypothetical protein
MKHLSKLLFASALLGALSGAPASAQQASGQGCINSGVNGVPQPGQNCLIESAVFTYAAVSVGLVPASSATDLVCLTGSSNKVVRLLSVKVGGTAGTALSTPVLITKHVTANSGGTAATGNALPVPYKVDTSDGTPTATTTAYTANPTINDASPGVIDAGISTFGVTTASSPSQQFNYFTHIYNEPPTIRGTAQQLCVNLNGVSVSTGSISISLYWTEQPQ